MSLVDSSVQISHLLSFKTGIQESLHPPNPIHLQLRILEDGGRRYSMGPWKTEINLPFINDVGAGGGGVR